MKKLTIIIAIATIILASCSHEENIFGGGQFGGGGAHSTWTINE